MKKNILTLTLAASLVFGATSCQNLLEIKETDFIAGETALRTVKNNESLILGAYAVYEPEMSVRLNGSFSDELRKGEFYNSSTTHEWNFAFDDISIRDTYTAITGLYRVVDRANRALQALPNAVTESDSDNVLRGQLEGEALFLRAIAHFDLFRYYAGNFTPEGLAMPYMLEPSLDPQERWKMGDYFTQLLKDINDAKVLLPKNLNDKARANYMAAVGLQARVALYMRNWTEAEALSTEFINALPLASKAEFPGIWKDQNTSEVAFMIVRNSGTRMGNFYRPLFSRDSEGNLTIGQISWYPSDKLFNTFDKNNDIRFDSYFVEEPVLSAANRHNRLVNKYSGSGYVTTNENVGNIKVFRTGEMYLIRAEARAELNKVSGANSAESDLNALRAARIDSYTPVTLSSKEQAITEILQERFKELAFEGHRFWDLKRRNLPVVRTGDDAPSAQGATLPAGNFRFVLPIPQTEMQANPLMEQNPDY